MLVLGINEGINSSVLVADGGRPLLAIQEERLTRTKNEMGFPDRAVEFALSHLGLSPGDVDCVCLTNEVSARFDRESFYRWYDETADRSLRSAFEGDLPRSLGRRLRDLAGRDRNAWVRGKLAAHGLAERPLRRTNHHLNHAASAYFGLRADDGPYLVLTLDGGGDDDCAHVYRAEGGRLELLAATPNGHSIGHLFARITYMLGMTPHEHEYKLMGLAPYADPRYAEPLVGRLRGYLDLDPANPLAFKRRTKEPTHLVQPRLERDLRRARFDGVAAAIQAFTEDLLCRWVAAAVERTGIRRVLAAGGVFMNVKANKLIGALEQVERFDVFPSCGDESLPFGAAWLAEPGRLTTYALGPDGAFDLEPALAAAAGVEARRLEDPEATAAELLADGKVVARCSGPMEFGARALGNRSILADPSHPEVVPVINRMIKQRDFWMPFAPAVLAERARDYLEVPATLPAADPSPFMMHTFDTTARRPEIAAAIHQQDGTARAQTVSAEVSPAFHRLLREFERRTGRGAVLNTSFNLHGYPIVLGARDAIDVLLRSSLEYLIVGDLLITKR